MLPQLKRSWVVGCRAWPLINHAMVYVPITGRSLCNIVAQSNRDTAERQISKRHITGVKECDLWQQQCVMVVACGSAWAGVNTARDMKSRWYVDRGKD